MCFVVLFDRMSSNFGILWFHDGIIINTDNDITYNGESHEFLTATLDSHEFLTATLDMSLNELYKMLCD